MIKKSYIQPEISVVNVIGHAVICGSGASYYQDVLPYGDHSGNDFPGESGIWGD